MWEGAGVCGRMWEGVGGVSGKGCVRVEVCGRVQECVRGCAGEAFDCRRSSKAVSALDAGDESLEEIQLFLQQSKKKVGTKLAYMQG